MKPGDKVSTLLGTGVIISREGEVGILSHRFIVKLDQLPKATYYRILHTEQGGLAFLDKEMTLIKKQNTQLILHY